MGMIVAKGHAIRVEDTPSDITVYCTCGTWSRTISKEQAASDMNLLPNAAVEHYRSIKTQTGDRQ